MPEVICNTSALQYLHQLGLLHLLRDLYGAVTVPEPVAREIAAGREQGVNLPDLTASPWIRLEPVTIPAVATGDLGAGELAVITLAGARPGSVVVLDDGLARRYARLAGIRFTGTCGVLLRAKERGLVPAIAPLLGQLDSLDFRLDAGTRTSLLKLAGESE
jgi:predicted nucleic acid-binding protein